MSILKIFLLSTLLLGVIIINENAQAHPGRTDSSGCHTCRTNCASWGLSTGEYHCHNAKTSVPQPKEPIKSIYGEDGTGYTKPAPEYKAPQYDLKNTENTDTSEESTKGIYDENDIEKTDITGSIDIETNNDSKNIPNIIESSSDSDSSLVVLIALFLIGGAVYLISRRKQ